MPLTIALVSTTIRSAPSARPRSRSRASAPTSGSTCPWGLVDPDEPERVGVGEAIEGEVVGLVDVLEPHGRGRADGLLRDVGVEVGDRAPEPQRERRGRSRQGALARVETAHEQHGACVASGSIDEPVVLVHCAPPFSTEVG